MVPLEPSGKTTGRLDHPKPEDIEENNFKQYLMKMMETLNEKVKNSLREMEEKTNKQTKSEKN